MRCAQFEGEYKFEISLKEVYETEYWLELLFETGYVDEQTYKPIQNNCGAIRRMLISSIKTIKENHLNKSVFEEIDLSAVPGRDRLFPQQSVRPDRKLFYYTQKI